MLRTSRARLKTAAVILAVVICAAIAAHHMSVPLNPRAWHSWYLGLIGEDHYDPDRALLKHGDIHTNEVALTIDDGPNTKYCRPIVDELMRDHVPAEFFLVGVDVEKHPDDARLIAQDGFGIGNHTYDHKRLIGLKPHEIGNELRLGDEDIYRVTGLHTNLMRPPGMEFNNKVLEVAKYHGYVTVDWTTGAKDYEQVPADEVVRRVMKKLKPGGIIILHQDQQSTVDALPSLVRSVRAAGYRFVTLSAMLSRVHAVLPVGHR